MRAFGTILILAMLSLTGCKKDAPADSGKYGVMDSSSGEAAESASPEAAAGDAPAGGEAAIKVAVPQIAYIYRYGFELPVANISAVQQRHIAACDKLGPLRCRVLEMQSGTSDGKATGGTLKLVVEARQARSFGASLAAAVTSSGGKQSESSIEAEDLSKQIVDTDARLRAKQALAERLMQLLRNRNGPVADLVEAERRVAEVQEEIDAAQSWLAEARGRVSMSTFEISYAAGDVAGGGFWQPLKSSLETMGSFLGQSLSILITLIAVLLPWALLGAAIFFAVRWIRRRIAKPEAE